MGADPVAKAWGLFFFGEVGCFFVFGLIYGIKHVKRIYLNGLLDFRDYDILGI